LTIYEASVSSWYLVAEGDQQKRVAVASSSGGTWVFVDGNVWLVESSSGERPRARRGGDSSVMSPMPATVVAINTAAGKTVNEGDTLIVLEAMKMELPIRAPRGGVVKAIHCAKGELVQPGVNLLEIE
jgi:acetyl-CoA/propionyl-CoA carboxylase, biotin carboxylase, biotin carboxyl carrier protein